MRSRALLAAGLASGLAVSSLTGIPAASAETLDEAVLRIINGHRATGVTCANEAGSPARPAVAPLARDPLLGRAAANHSGYMTANDVFSHSEVAGSPGFTGATVGDRYAHVGYAASAWGENIAAGNSTPEATVRQWLTSSTGHCSLMMNGRFTRAGAGYAYGASSTYRHYWTLNVGSEPIATAVAPGVVEAEASLDGEVFVVPSTLAAPTTAPWWVRVRASSAGTGTYRVQIWSTTTSTWSTAASGLTTPGRVQLPPLTAAQLDDAQQVRVRTFVDGPLGAPGAGTAGPTTTLQFGHVATPTANKPAPVLAVAVKGSTVTGRLAKRQVRKVHLQRLTSGGTWRTVTTRKTSSRTGKVTFTRLKKGTQYRLSAPRTTVRGTPLVAIRSRTFTR